MRVAMIAAGLVLATTPAFAEDATPAPKAPDDKQKIICRTEQPTGSRISTRICMTKAEWEGVSDTSRESMERLGPGLRRNDMGAARPGSSN